MTIAEAKKHLNIDAEFTLDDDYIGQLIEVSTDAVKQHLNINDLTELGEVVPPAVNHAILLMIGNLYANRESVIIGVSVTEIPLSYQYLLSLYRKY